MPRKSEKAFEKKRQYNRERNRRLRLAEVSPQRGIIRGVVPAIKRRDVVPIPMNPQTMSKRKLVGYLEHVGQRGFSLAQTGRGYELVANTGELVPFDGVAIIEGQLRTHGQRITQLEAELARLEMMMDSLLREGELR